MGRKAEQQEDAAIRPKEIVRDLRLAAEVLASASQDASLVALAIASMANDALERGELAAYLSGLRVTPGTRMRYALAMAERRWHLNWIGFLGLIGFVGFLGLVYDAPQAFIYFAYFQYFYYFREEISTEERWRIRTAGTIAYLTAFLTNMTFIVISYVRGSVDYETSFYLAYMLGSITFPATSFLMESAHKVKRFRSRRREPSYDRTTFRRG